MIEIIGFVALGALVGVVSSFFGIGGGVILVAALVAASDFGQQEAQATALAFMVPTAVIGVISTNRHGLGDVRQSAIVGVGGAAAAVGGALLALEIPADTLRALFAAFMAVLGLAMLLRPGGADEDGADIGGRA
ncbi:MAG: TSUP family transporter [Solirubrobacterales bacterium]